MENSARIFVQPNGMFSLEIISFIDPPRTDLLNLTDKVRRFEDLTLDAVISRLQEEFRPIAHP